MTERHATLITYDSVGDHSIELLHVVIHGDVSFREHLAIRVDGVELPLKLGMDHDRIYQSLVEAMTKAENNGRNDEDE